MIDPTSCVRLGSADDLARVEVMWARLYDLQREQGMQATLPPDAFAIWVASMRTALGRFAALFVAERPDSKRSGAPVFDGFLGARIRRAPAWLGGETIGYVSEVWIEAGSRRRGLGAQLVRAAEAWFAAQGATRVELQVMVENRGGRALYEKVGWRVELLQMTRPLR